MSQLTSQGFKRLRYDDWLTMLEEEARREYGADVDLTDANPLTKLLKMQANMLAKMSETAEDVYNSAYKDLAEGVSLDRVGKNVGIRRELEEYAVVDLEFSAEPGAFVDTKMIVALEGPNALQFNVIHEAREVDGIVRVKARAAIPGTIGNVPAGSIKIIVTTTDGITSVTNPTAAVGGRNREEDYQFKETYDKSLSKPGGSTVDAIIAELLQVPGVKDASAIENDTMEELPSGQPPKSIAPFVYGGDDAEIVQAIFRKKAGGIRSWGKTEVTVFDSKKQPHIIGFTRPTTIGVWVRVTLVKNELFPFDGNEQITTAIIKYIGGEDASKNGAPAVVYDGLGLDADIVHYKVIAALGGIPGIEDVVVELSTDGVAFAQANIQIDKNSVGKTKYDKVVIR